MADFHIQPREYPQIRELILSRLPEFGRSPAYERLSEFERALPTVVTGAFARYLNGLLNKSKDDEEASRLLRVALEVMERLASSSDPEVQNALIVEVFEQLDLTDDDRQGFRRGLPPASKALYDRWVRS